MLLALMSCEARPLYRWWTRYLGASLLIAPFYWPEIPGWTETFWPALLAVAVLRLVALLEALHHQTKHLRSWYGLMGGAFLFATLYCRLLWNQTVFSSELASWLKLAQATKMWPTWVALLVTGYMWVTRSGIRREADRHAALVCTLCIVHGVVAFVATLGQFTKESWVTWDMAATLADAGIYLSWAFTCRCGADPDRSGARAGRFRAGRPAA